MSRIYNPNISHELNEILDRREEKVRLQKRMIAVIGILAISLIILLGSSICAFAGSRSASAPVYKYYTSVRIEQGDTLWTIADTYISDYDIDKKEYLDEVCRMNHLRDGQVHRGDYIVVPYYSLVER